MFTDYVLSENDKSDIRLHQTSLIVINSLIIIGKKMPIFAQEYKIAK